MIFGAVGCGEGRTTSVDGVDDVTWSRGGIWIRSWIRVRIGCWVVGGHGEGLCRFGDESAFVGGEDLEFVLAGCEVIERCVWSVGGGVPVVWRVVFLADEFAVDEESHEVDGVAVCRNVDGDLDVDRADEVFACKWRDEGGRFEVRRSLVG